MIILNTLYAKNKDGSLQQWSVCSVGDTITVEHGKVGGKLQTKKTVCEGKNIGKVNETTPDEQAEIEALAKWVKQKKREYYDTQEEALAHISIIPMTCQDYKKFADRVEYPCFMQPKLNGLRCLITKDGVAMSKSGEIYTLPEHIQKDINVMKQSGLLENGLDGEIWAGLESDGGLSLQRINSAFKKPNKDTEKLKLYVYNIPKEDTPLTSRMIYLGILREKVGMNENLSNITVLGSWYVQTKVYSDLLHRHWVEDGHEGSIYLNEDGMYEHGVRSYDMIKRKNRSDSEALVLSVEKDKNGQGVLTCQMENGVIFKCLMLKPKGKNEVNLRLYEHALGLVNQHINFEYEEFSDSGTPTKPVGRYVREMIPGTWNPKE